MLVSPWPFIPQLKMISRADYFSKYNAKATHDLRPLVSILALDDESFSPERNLRIEGFNITSEINPERISLVAPHGIVICDLKGVFRHLSKRQGAFAVKSIKDSYPDKIVIAFTNAGTNEDIYMYAELFADKIIKKGDTSRLINTLDECIKDYLTPSKKWYRIRRLLISRDVDSHKIAYIEHFLTESIEKDDYSLFEKGIKSVSLPVSIVSSLATLSTLAGGAQVLAGAIPR